MSAISVIMPVYNTQQYLNRSIHSLMEQSLTDFELILVNDGSVDYSVLYCKALAKRDRRIRVFDLPHGGIAAARIAGIAAASGDYVSFVDSDDLVEKDFLLHLYQAVRAEGADISMCQFVWEYADQSNVSSFPNGTYRGSGLRKLILSDLFCNSDRTPGKMPLFLWNKLFERTLLLDNLKYLDYRMAAEEDMLLFYACLLSSKCFTVVGDHDYHYCIRKNSTVSKGRAGAFDVMLRFRYLAKAMLAKKGFADLDYRVDAKTLYQIAAIIKQSRKEGIPPLPEELMDLIREQAKEDGCDQWREAVKTVTNYYLPKEENK